MKKILTYGTFDLLHWGHVIFLQQAKELGDYLVVGLSTDEFNTIKHKISYYPYDKRKLMLEALRCVDEVIPENDWHQKPDDIKAHSVDVIVMGSDWKGDEKFEKLREHCEIAYIERAHTHSTSKVKTDLKET